MKRLAILLLFAVPLLAADPNADPCADRDLHNRIGMVESWGQPAFSLSIDLAATRSDLR